MLSEDRPLLSLLELDPVVPGPLIDGGEVLLALGLGDGHHNLLVADEVLDHRRHEGHEGPRLLQDQRGDLVTPLRREVPVAEDSYIT